MTVKKLLSALLLFTSLSLFSQYDPSAQKYLDILASSIKTDKGLVIDFEAKVSKLGDNEELENEKGSLLLKQNKSKLKVAGTTTYCDNTTQWLVMDEEKEVTIQAIEKDEVTPASIFTLYKKGYRFRILEETEEKAIIELTPEDKKSPYVRITLYINKEGQQLNAFALQSRNAIVTSVNITSWKETMIDDKQLIFDADQNPDIEIIDLR